MNKLAEFTKSKMIIGDVALLENDNTKVYVYRIDKDKYRIYKGEIDESSYFDWDNENLEVVNFNQLEDLLK